MEGDNVRRAPLPPNAWMQLGCQKCGSYFWWELKSGDRQPMFCNPCLGSPNPPIPAQAAG